VTLPTLWIATTRGPVEVVSITEEDPEIRSVLCLADSFQELPISPFYDAFVRRPTGLIEQITGHPSYRIDLSGPITQGQSWQLGLTVAHLFAAEAKQANFSPPDALIWTTGLVTPKGMVLQVDEIALKWQMTCGELARSSWHEKSIIIMAHAANIEELQALEKVSASGLSITYVPVSSVGDIIGYFDLSIGKVPTPPTTPSKGKIPMIVAAFVGMLATLTILVKLATDVTAPLSRLDQEGRYRELFMEMRLMRQEGNWLDVNGAFFFQKYLEFRAAGLGDDIHIEIRSVSQTSKRCKKRTATITTDTLPDWVHHPCKFQLTVANKSDRTVGIWVAFTNHEPASKANLLTRNHALLQAGQSITLPEFTIDGTGALKTLLAIASQMPDLELMPWFDAIANARQADGQMIDRIYKSGTGLRFASGSTAQE
jgi:hypothetical protein